MSVIIVVDFIFHVLYLKENSFGLVQLPEHSVHQTIQMLGQYHISIYDYYRNKWRQCLLPSGQFSKTCFIMYIGKLIYIEKANILGITFPLSLHKLIAFH